MSLRVAVQMDPLEGINIEGDSTFAIMLARSGAGTFVYIGPGPPYERPICTMAQR